MTSILERYFTLKYKDRPTMIKDNLIAFRKKLTEFNISENDILSINDNTQFRLNNMIKDGKIGVDTIGSSKGDMKFCSYLIELQKDNYFLIEYKVSVLNIDIPHVQSTSPWLNDNISFN